MRNSPLLVALFFLAGLIGPVWADETAPDYSGVPAGTPNVVGQAAEATVGRIFGVEGDASQIKYHEIEFTRHSPLAAATRSLLVPGWGQYFNRQRAKGTIFFITTVGVAFASAHVYGRARDSYDIYKAKGDKDDSHYDDYERQRNTAIILGGTAIVIWAISIFDAYRNAYKPLYSRDSSVDVALLPEGGAEMRLKKSF